MAQQKQVARPKITGIAYVRLYTADLHKSREFYRTVLGLGGDTMDCVAAGASCFSVNGRQSVGLAQITGGTPDNLVAEIAFATPDVEQMRRYLAAHGKSRIACCRQNLRVSARFLWATRSFLRVQCVTRWPGESLRA